MCTTAKTRVKFSIDSLLQFPFAVLHTSVNFSELLPFLYFIYCPVQEISLYSLQEGDTLKLKLWTHICSCINLLNTSDTSINLLTTMKFRG